MGLIEDKAKGIVDLEKRIPEYEEKVSKTEEEFSSLQERKITGASIDPKSIKSAREAWESAKDDLQFAIRTLEKLKERFIKSVGEEKEKRENLILNLQKEKSDLTNKFAAELFEEAARLQARLFLIFGNVADDRWFKYLPVVGSLYEFQDFTNRVNFYKKTNTISGKTVVGIESELSQERESCSKSPEDQAEELLKVERLKNSN